MDNKLRFGSRISRRTTLPLAAASALLFAQGCSPGDHSEGAQEAQLPDSARTSPQMALSVQRSGEHLKSMRRELGLSNDNAFSARSGVFDQFRESHVRFDQTYHGIRVWGAEAIVRVSNESEPRSIISTLLPNIDVSTVPSLSKTQALSLAASDLKPVGDYVTEPKTELVIYPRIVERVKANRLRGPEGELNALDMEDVIEGYSLAYHVHTELENGAPETAHTDYLIDAHSGVILKKWSTLYTAAATGDGKSQYSGDVKLDVDSVAAGGFELRDVKRSMNITTYNLNNGTSGTGTVFSDADNKWGDGKNFTSGGSTTGDNGQTAGVDAHYGTEMTFDFYNNVHGRNGIDGAGLATYTRVHYSRNYDNAFWTDTCFCMTYGDGSMFTVLTSLDVAGHEMTHGVTSRTAKLVYSGESGGLNESFSDIMGTMVEFYAREGKGGTTVPDIGGNWLIGEQLNMTPLRFMIKPSKDGASKDAWSSTLGGIDVHFSSGPLNRAFYFLSKGASTTTGADDFSTYLPGGMTGIGNDKASRIAFRALTVKLTSTSKYAQARTAFLDAAKDLYGDTGAEYKAVGDAFTAINVGATTADTVKPTTTLTAPTAGATLTGSVTVSATAMDNVGVTKVEFYAGATLIGTDTTSPYSISWNSATVANGSYNLSSKAFDAAGNTGVSTNVAVTVSNMGADTVKPTTTLTAPTAGATLTGTVTVSANATDNVAVTKVEFYAGATLIGSDTTSPYSVSWNTTTVTNGSYVITSKAYDAAGNVGTSPNVSVTVSNVTADTTPPVTSLTAPTAGSTLSGTATVSANATDNIAVTKVEFYAGTTLIGSDTTSPYSVSWNTTTVMNGSYNLTSKAYDAAGNVGTSGVVAVTVKNGGTCGTTSQLLKNPGFESGAVSWSGTSGVIDNSDPASAHSGSWVGWLGGYGLPITDNLYQEIAIPADACSAQLSFWLKIETAETDPAVYDKLTVTVRDTANNVLSTLGSYSNVNAGAYSQKTFDLSAYKGKTVRVHFRAVEDLFLLTNFFIDDTALNITK